MLEISHCCYVTNNTWQTVTECAIMHNGATRHNRQAESRVCVGVGVCACVCAEGGFCACLCMCGGDSVCVCVCAFQSPPLSNAMRKSRLRCSSLMNSSFCRKRAMRSSSRYCFSFLSCSEAEYCVREDSEDDDDEEGCDRLLWERLGCRWQVQIISDDRSLKNGVFILYNAMCIKV